MRIELSLRAALCAGQSCHFELLLRTVAECWSTKLPLTAVLSAGLVGLSLRVVTEFWSKLSLRPVMSAGLSCHLGLFWRTCLNCHLGLLLSAGLLSCH